MKRTPGILLIVLIGAAVAAAEPFPETLVGDRIMTETILNRSREPAVIRF